MIYAVACASGWYRYSAEGEVKLLAIPDYSSHPWTLFSTFHLKLFSAIPQAQCLALGLGPGPKSWAQQQDWIPTACGGAFQRSTLPLFTQHTVATQQPLSSHSIATQ